MARSYDSPGARLRAQWSRLAHLPGGRWLFSRLLGLMVPYTATIRPRVERLDPGHVVVRMRDRRGVRNHLRSIHAVALSNLGELCTGLALMGAMPPTVRGIPIALDTRYLKKARGELVAEARCEVPEVTEARDFEVVTEIRDRTGDVVATVVALWRLAPVEGASTRTARPDREAAAGAGG